MPTEGEIGIANIVFVSVYVFGDAEQQWRAAIMMQAVITVVDGRCHLPCSAATLVLEGTSFLQAHLK